MIASGEIIEPPKPKQAISERRVLKQKSAWQRVQTDAQRLFNPNSEFETADSADLRLLLSSIFGFKKPGSNPQ